MNRRFLIAFLMSLRAVGAAADSVIYDRTAVLAHRLLQEWSVGVLDTEAAITKLTEIVESATHTEEGRAVALRNAAWIDIHAKEINLTRRISAFSGRRDVPSPVLLEAAALKWQLYVFGRGLGPVAQAALLRRIMKGKVGSTTVDEVVRGWAAEELCARGIYDDEVRELLRWRFRAGAAERMALCERQQEFIKGPRDLAAVKAALQVLDLSASQAFRILVIETAASRPSGDDAQVTRPALGAVGRGEPAAALGTRHILVDLVKEGLSPEQMRSKGIHSDLVELVFRARRNGADD